jgi:hypothetical protein
VMVCLLLASSAKAVMVVVPMSKPSTTDMIKLLTPQKRYLL